jgi:hypothetical protein
MGTVMGSDDYLRQWLAEEVPSKFLLTPMPKESAQVIVDLLKNEADRHWSIDPNYSLKYADRIVAIGHAQKDESTIALGLMAKGDAFQFLGQINEAWDMLEEAGTCLRRQGTRLAGRAPASDVSI